MKKNNIVIISLLIAATFLACSNADKENSGSKLIVQQESKKVILQANQKDIVVIDSICFDFKAPEKITIKEKSENKTVLELLYTNVSYSDRVNLYKDQLVTIDISHDDGTWHFYAETKWARHISIYLQDLGGHYYGLNEILYPENRKSPDLRGAVVDVLVRQDIDRYWENLASAWSSFYYNNLGYASFFNTFHEGRYYLAVNGKTCIYHSTGTLDWYLFTGNNGNDILENYYKVIGKPKYVPEWACGPIIWRDDNKGGAPEILDDVSNFTKLQIPLTAMFVDRPYSNGYNGWSKMDFNAKFENPDKWIKKLNTEYDIKIMTWISPSTFGDKNFPGLLNGRFCYMDLSNPEVIDEWGKKLKENQYDYGVVGHKMDRADEYFPEHEYWYDRTPTREKQNKYIFLYAKTVDTYLKDSWGKDQFNFARAAIHGVQPYLSAIWGGDVRTSWDGLAGNLANSIRASFMGFPNWGTDVGGYKGETGKIPDDLYIRWLQWGVWTGFYEIKIDGAGGNGEDRAPWNCSEQVQEAFKKVCDERMTLIPYIYSHLNTAYKNGTLMKPLAMMFPNDKNTYHIWDEYLFGNSFLVAPIITGSYARSIYLPDGEWIDYNKPATRYKGNQYIKQSHDLSSIPVFIRDNSVFVTGTVTMGNVKKWLTASEKLTINAYVSATKGYSDFDFVDSKDEDKVKTITLKSSKEESILEIPVIKSEEIDLIINSKVKPVKVTMNDESVAFDYQNGIISIGVTGGEIAKVKILY